MDWWIQLFHAISLPDFLGHIFYIIILTGTTLVGNKKKTGWLFRIVGDLGWVLIGWYIGMYSIMIWSSIFALNELRNYRLWRKYENLKLQSQGQGATETCSKEDKGSIQSARRGRSKPSDGFPGCGHHAKCNCLLFYTALNRSQEYQNLSEPKRARSSKVQRKARANPSGGMETPKKRDGIVNSIPKSRRLSKINKGKN